MTREFEILAERQIRRVRSPDRIPDLRRKVAPWCFGAIFCLLLFLMLEIRGLWTDADTMLTTLPVLLLGGALVGGFKTVRILARESRPFIWETIDDDGPLVPLGHNQSASREPLDP